METIDGEKLDPKAYSATHELNNAGAYLRNMADNFLPLKKIMATRDATLPTIESNCPAIITGSGPSLTEAMPHLEELREKLGAKLLVGVSQLWAMIEARILPDYLVVNDIWPGTGRYLPKTPDRRKIAKRIVPVIHPGVWREIMDWPDLDKNAILYRAIMAKEDRGAREQTDFETAILEGLPISLLPQMVAAITGILYTHNPDLKYPIRKGLFLAPDTPLQSALVAQSLGYDPVYLVGYDLCFWKGRSRARTLNGDGTAYDGDIFAGEAEETKSGFKASKNMLYYRTAALVYQTKFKFRMCEVVVDGTPGNLHYLPQVPLEELLRGNQPSLKWPEDYEMKLRLFYKDNPTLRVK